MCVCVFVCVCIHMYVYTHTDRQTDRQTDRHRQTQTETDTHRRPGQSKESLEPVHVCVIVGLFCPYSRSLLTLYIGQPYIYGGLFHWKRGLLRILIYSGEEDTYI